MKFGVKTYSDYEFLRHFEKKIDFFEVQAIQGKDYSFLKNFSLPIVIHAEHQAWGVDISSPEQRKINFKAIDFARKIADSISAKKIIIHAGGDIGNSIEESINFLNALNDDRIIVENVVRAWVGASFSDIKKILDKTGKGFCFDVNHAILYCWENNLDIFSLIKKFLELNPKHFHIGGQRKGVNGEIGHLLLKEFDYNWEDILKLYPKDAEITLETAPNIKDTEEDIKLIKKISKIL